MLTYPFFEEEVVERTETGTEMVETVDDLTGETVKVRRPRYTEERKTVRRAIVNPPALDTPGRTLRDARRLLTDPGGGRPSLLDHIFWSTVRILSGFLVSALLAVPLGIAMGLYPRLRATISPIISFLRPLPSIAWVPLAAIWLGVGEAQKLAIIFMGSFSAALIYTVEATLRVDPVLVRAALNLGVSERQLLGKVLLPAALPSIVSGLKVVMAIGWTCVISAEIVGTQKGLGSLIWSSKEISKTSWVLVGMASISTMVLMLDALFHAIEKRLLPWVFLEERRG
ncbi:MAG: ABC transporter permease [Planctomycetota bacterium]